MKKTMTRIAACSLAVLIAFNSALVPRSKAVGAEVVGTAALATSTLAAYMTATGVPLTVTAGGAAAASAGAASLISGYAAATGGTYSVVTTALASGVTIGTGGAIIIGAAAAALLAGIVTWVVGKYALTSGEGVSLIDGRELRITSDSNLPDYPYWMVCSPGGDTRLLFADKPFLYYRYSSAYCIGTKETCNYLWYRPSSGTWSFYSSGSGECSTLVADFIGANCDIVKDDGSIITGLTSHGFVLSADYAPLPDLAESEQVELTVNLPAGIQPEDVPDAIFEKIADNEFESVYEISPVPDSDPTPNPDTGSDSDSGLDSNESIGWLRRIALACESLADKIIDGVRDIFVPDAALTTQITDAFAAKFSFVSTLHRLGTDLLSIGPDSKPPVVYIHLEDAEGTIDYGGTVKALDMSWYQRYKEDGDRIIGGFLWLGFLWLLFKRVPAIINGGEMVQEYTADIDRGSKRRKH